VYRTALTIIFVALGTAIVSAQIKVACIGNSITTGTGISTPSYVPRLQELLGSNFTVENDGYPGITILKNGDYSYWTLGSLSQVFAFQPDIVTIKLGTNDTKIQNWDQYGSEFKQDYEAMIDTLNTLPTKPEIFPVLPVPSFTNGYGVRDSVMVNYIFPIIKEIGLSRGLTVIDAYTPLLPFSSYFADGLHPDTAGTDTIAHVIYRSIMLSIHTITPVMPTSGAAIRFHVQAMVPGCNESALFTGIQSGKQYEFRIFDARGVMFGKFTVDASRESQKAVRRMLRTTASMRLVAVKSL
jgi:acyl-CoA thioesterase I